MLTVHHLGQSQSERIVWLCEELELPYELVRYQRLPSGAAPPEYKALHPFGTAPTITDGDFVLGESGAIIEYICNRYAGGRLVLGPDHPNYADFLYWLHFANASMIASLMMDYAAKMAGAEPVGDRMDRCYRVSEMRLAAAPYFAGEEFTAADIMMGFPLTSGSAALGRDLTAYPAISAYRERIRERPGYQRARMKAEPDSPA
jgi:glutathione S-transferase